MTNHWGDYQHGWEDAVGAMEGSELTLKTIDRIRAAEREAAIDWIYAECDGMTEEYGACSDCERIADLIDPLKQARP